ncbi:MAG: hypothetical protein GFH25_541324n40 [Chloroflexi bacterium AL-N10]|nr:hypothetical protein [Chloroflexi bacterium AL-N10]
MRRFLVIVCMVTSILSTILMGTPQQALFAAPTTSPPVPAPAPTDPAGSLEMTEMVAHGSQPDAVCVFSTQGDYVHISSTPPRSASGHGWWINGNCQATHAVVTVQLQQNINGRWRNVGSAGRATVRSGGGAGNRATGRVTCTSSTLTQWRSVIDVDLVGMIDDPRKLTTPTRSLSCRH